LTGEHVEWVLRVQEFAKLGAKELTLRNRNFWVSFFASFGDQTAQNLANFSAIKQTMHPLFKEDVKFVRDD
jgi:hypothetical protein